MKIICILLIGISCNRTGKSDSLDYAPENDNLSQLNNVVKTFNADEKKCEDSIALYQLTSVSEKCIALLYKTYAFEKAYDRLGNEFTTIGECNIRIVRFRRAEDGNFILGYEAFWQDSIPLSWKTGIYKPATISAFEVDGKEREIIQAFFGPNVSAAGKDVIDDADSIFRTTTMTAYIENKRKKLNKKLLKSLLIAQ